MISLIGQYHCKLDAKGRFLMPSDLRRQLPGDQQSVFVINRGMDRCLVLWPMEVWNRESAKVRALNPYKEKNRTFKRFFFHGARQISLDGSGRVLLAGMLSEYAGLNKDLVIVAQGDRAEIWDQGAYDEWMTSHGSDIGDLAEEVMGDLDIDFEDD